jgi:hypothetical protein
MDSNKYLRLTSVGTSQEGRAFPALDFDYVKIDERSFEDLLVFASGFSKLINFYNLKNKVEGDWSEFLNDETVILATIIDSNPQGVEINFKNNIHKASLFKRSEKRIFYLRKCFKEIYDVALRFQTWLTRLKAVEVYIGEDLAIKSEISSAISSKLSTALRILYDQQEKINKHLSEEERINLNFTRFDFIWGLRLALETQDSVQSTSEEEQEPKTLKQETDQIITQLQVSFQAFYETLLYLKMKAPEYLHQSLKTDTHYPEVALFLAFLKLFKYAQGNINNLSKRHLDFYYNIVLQQRPKDPVRDKVYLKFLPYNTAVFAQVKKGTSFIAGEDQEGNEVVYQADYDLQVNKAQIERLRTVHISRKSLNVKGTEKVLFKEILSSDVHISALTRKPEDNTPKKSYATFGESQEGKGSHEKTMTDATLGFVITSPVLFLKEGYREISLTLQFAPETYKGFIQKLEDIAYVERSTESEIFIKSFLEAFGIQITIPEGWYSISKYVISRNNETSSLVIGFDLDESEPAVTRYEPLVHDGIFRSKAPLIKILLNSETYIYPYSLLKDLVLEEVDIKVNVRGVREVLLYNNMGQLSPDNPFYPFGPMPNVGSYLLIGSNEIFRKSLDDLHVNIEWYDLPRSKSGFYGHYEDYGVDIDNSSFEAKISILDNGRWKPASKEQQVLKLFRTEGDPEGKEVNPKSGLDEETLLHEIEVGKIKQAPDYAGLEQNLLYTSTAQRGFVKLELAGPDVGFAHTVYPAVLSEVAIRNSRSSLLQIGEKKMDKMPSPPYSPQIKSISLDYSSSAVISLKDRSNRGEGIELRGCVYHIHPFGQELVYPDNSTQVTYLLPDYSYEGSLMIGFANLNPPQTVSILFEMFDEYTVSSEEDPPVIEWNYLANNRWHYLKPSRIVRDDTSGFIKTGIIEIELPYEINKNNSILDPNLFWIRACVLKNIDVASKTVSVYTQVLTATLSENYNVNGSHLKKNLPAFTIQRSLENIEGIESVVQPLESFNRRPKEGEFDYYTRVGERLKHKARAIMPWDYERIILEKFPDVFKVACLPNMTSKNLDAPGSVLIVVCPFVNQNVEVHEPMASSELLYQIKNYIAQFVSPFVRLEVRNPSYERIKIICSVKFTDGYNYGYFLQKLNEELKKYLSKSTDGGQSSLHLGGKVNTSDILSFMRTLPYVDFITKFSMVQAARDFAGNWILIDTSREGDSKAFLQATKPWSVLVPAIEHQITVLNEKLEERSLQAGIDSLELGHDFIIE